MKQEYDSDSSDFSEPEDKKFYNLNRDYPDDEPSDSDTDLNDFIASDSEVSKIEHCSLTNHPGLFGRSSSEQL